jgi:hypothetical protein
MRHTAWMIAAAGSIAAPAIAAPCDPGTYSPTGETPCVQAEAGYYVPGTGMTVQLAAEPGFFVSNPGQSVASQAPAGYYASGFAATSATPASPGHFVPSPGQSTQFAASPGRFVPGFAATSAGLAPAGFYVPGTAATAPTKASPGHYVPIEGAANQTPASAGYFVAFAGQTSQQKAAPGFYVASEGQSAATPAGVGHYVPFSGMTTQLAAEPGYYVPLPGSANGIACGAGTESYGGAELCRIVSPLANSGTGPNLVASQPSSIDFGSVRLGSSATQLLTLSNLPLLGAIGSGITDLSLLSFTLSGSDFAASGLVPTLVLGDGDNVQLSLIFTPTALGNRFGLLSIQTDQTASFGASGDVFRFDLTGQGAVPEPGTWMMLLTGFLGIGAVSRRKAARTRLQARAPV